MSESLQLPLRGAIVAMTEDRVIGLHGKIPWYYSADLKRFKRRTMDSTIVMGRLTWESIGSKPLPGRRNIVISRNPVQHVESFTSVEYALNWCESEDTWVIGGGQIYQASMQWLNLLDVTFVPEKINHPEAVRFPVIDPKAWIESESSASDNTRLKNVLYRRK